MSSKAGNKKIDMLNGPIWSKLPKFALPIAATAILEQLFNASDVAVVGNFASSDKTAAVAAVGANASVINLVLNLFIGIALGANVVIANAIGRGDRKAVEKAVHTAIVTAVIGGIAVAVLGEIVADVALRSLRVPDDVFPLALVYLRIYLLGMPVILLYNFEAAVFRSVGDTKMPLIALALSGVLNVILNLFFVIVFKMTVDGVAVATVISNIVSAAILFVRLKTTDKAIHVDMRKLRIDKHSFKKIMKIGFPAGVQSAMFSVSNIVIQSAINSLGKIVMAASSAAANIETIAYYVHNSFSQACTTFVGQNYGAGKFDRCRKTLVLCLIEDAVATAAAVGLVLTTGRFLLSVFNNNSQVIEIGYVRLIFVFASYTFTMLYDVMSGYLRGFGISLVPAIIATVGVCGLRIVWIKAVFPHICTFSAIMTAYPVSLGATALMMIIALIYYRPAHKRLNKQLSRTHALRKAVDD